MAIVQARKMAWISAFFFVASILFLIIPTQFVSAAQSKEEKVGAVLYVSKDGKFVFINLGRSDAKEKDFVKIYRNSKYIATGSVTRVMEKMSEASILEKDSVINIGDRIVISGPQKDLPGTTESTFYETQPPPLPEAIPPPVKEKFTTLHVEEPRVESTLGAEVTPLEDSQQSLRLKLANFKKSGEDTILKIEKQLDTLEESRKVATERKEELQNLEERLRGRRSLLIIGLLVLLALLLTFVFTEISTRTKARPPQAKMPPETEKPKEVGEFEPRNLKEFLKKRFEKQDKDLFK